MATTKHHDRRLVAVLLLWGVALVASFGGLSLYASTAGEKSAPPRDESFAADPGEWRLVMAIHPRCPCTRASLAELGRLLADLDALTCDIYIDVPSDIPGSWTDTDTVRLARELPRTTLHLDPLGEVAVGLGIHTSGGVVLYDSTGEPCFFGGLTSSRSHEGDNLGTLAVHELLRGQTPTVTQRPVFGCSLLAPERGI